MPNYAVLYKTEADPDGRLWPIGPLPNRDHALDLFNNNTAKAEKIGPFTLEEIDDLPSYYNLVEQQTPNGIEVFHPLYMALTQRERLRRVTLLCCHFARNLAYHRAGLQNGQVQRQDSEFWVTVNGNFLDECVLRVEQVVWNNRW